MILKIGHDLLVENTSFPRPQSAAAAHRFMPRSRTALEITNWIQDNSNDLAGLKKTRWPHHKWHLGFEGWCLWLRFGKNLLFSAESLQKIFSGWVLFCKPTDPIYLGSNVILSASFTWQWFISQPREHIFEWEHMGKSSVIIIIILWVSSHPGHLQGQENRHSQSHQHWCHCSESAVEDGAARRMFNMFIKSRFCLFFFVTRPSFLEPFSCKLVWKSINFGHISHYSH